MNQKHFRLVNVFVCLILLARAGLAHDLFEKQAEVDRAVIQEMKQQQLVGVAIGIIRNATVAYTQGYGYSNLDRQTPVTTSSVFNWASNCKPLLAVAAMQLVQKGLLDVDVPIKAYLPSLSQQFSGITSRQLLCHQSGIPHYSNGQIVPSGERMSVRAELDPFNSVHRFALSPLLFEPGTKTDYSSYAYVLLSAVVQAAGNSRLDQQILERIGKPLELESFQLDLPFDGQQHWVTSYKGGDGVPVEIEDYAHFWKHGAGGYKSDVEDFAKFANGLANRALINDETTDVMWTNQVLKNGSKSNYGLGVVVEGEGSSLKISHSGSQDETRTRMVLYPNQRHGIVVMCNTQGADTGKISTAIYAAMNGG